jgi:hypothetical protein
MTQPLTAAETRRPRPKIGDERWLLEIIDTADVEAMARLEGWNGEDGIREFCEPENASTYTVHTSLDKAVAAAREYLAKGTSFYGCAIIDHQVVETPHDDLGNLIDVPPEWERQRSYEVAMDGECIEVST